MDVNDFYWFWLCNIPGIGNRKIHKLVKALGDAKNVYQAGKAMLEDVAGLSRKDIKEILDSRKNCFYEDAAKRMGEKGISFIYEAHRNYPERLKEIEDRPAGLYYKGRLPEEGKLTVAIVGARSCTAYGRRVAYRFAQAFARMGIQVVSGMAAGIDSAGHEGCLSQQGYTCAVLGCGADVCYPRSNISLYTQIEQEGGIISEYPPQTPPKASLFPLRNRIISGLSDVVIVVEARAQSGSFITVDQALEQNREVMVIPGRIDDELSTGCNTLIKMGAQVITEPEEVLQCAAARRLKAAEAEKLKALKVLNQDLAYEGGKQNCSVNMLATQKDIVYSCLDYSNPKSLNIIIEETGLDLTVVSEMLLQMQLEGCIGEVSKNCYVRVYI